MNNIDGLDDPVVSDSGKAASILLETKRLSKSAGDRTAVVHVNLEMLDRETWL